MATADQIKALIKTHLVREKERFLVIELQVEAHAAPQGRGRLATDIRGLVDKVQARAANAAPSKPIPITTPRGLRRS